MTDRHVIWAPEPADATFRAFRPFNDPDLWTVAGSRSAIGLNLAERHFPGPGLPNQIVRALGAGRAIATKEVFESFELFERVRHRVRAPTVVDLCCGHGLTGILFAIFSRAVESVLLIDKKQPKGFDRIMTAISPIAPWAAEKITYVEQRLSQTTLPAGASVVAVHACGSRTDRCLDLALAARGALAVMPCCYGETGRDAPPALRKALGAALATDTHRTYRLEQAGYRVTWTQIPSAITPMNRVIVGTPNPE